MSYVEALSVPFGILADISKKLPSSLLSLSYPPLFRQAHLTPLLPLFLDDACQKHSEFKFVSDQGSDGITHGGKYFCNECKDVKELWHLTIHKHWGKSKNVVPRP